MREEVKKALQRQEDPDYKAILAGEVLVMDCLQEVCRVMEEKRVSNEEMAKMLKVSLYYWDSVLADSSISVRLLGHVASRLGMKVKVRLEE